MISIGKQKSIGVLPAAFVAALVNFALFAISNMDL